MRACFAPLLISTQATFARTPISLAVGLVCLYGAAGAQAQTTTETTVAKLSTITITANRNATDADAVAATTTVYGAEQINQLGASDIKDLFRYELGASVRAAPARFSAAFGSTGRAGNEGINIRGLEGNQVLMQIDGVRLPYAFSFGAQSTGRADSIDLDNLKAIEIVRGPASTLYGSDGLAGALSFVTKNPSDYLRGRNWYASEKLSYNGADRSTALTLTGAARYGLLEGLVVLTRRTGDGTRTAGTDESLNSTRTTPNPQAIAQRALLAKLALRPTSEHELKLTFETLRRDTETVVNTALPVVIPAAGGYTRQLVAFDDISRDRVSFEHRYAPQNSWFDELRWSVYSQRSANQQLAVEARERVASRERDNRYSDKLSGVSATLEATPATGHRVIAGFDSSSSDISSLRTGSVPPFGESYPSKAFPDTRYVIQGAFVQDEWQVSRALVLIPALRYDSYKLNPRQGDAQYPGVPPSALQGSAVSPKFGALWELSPGVKLIAQYAHGFRAPLPDQVNSGFTNVTSNYRTIANPNLKPESSNSLELGFRAVRANWRLDGTVFSGHYSNFIATQQVSGNFTLASPAVFQALNADSARISGIELRGRWQATAQLTLNAGLATTRGSRTDGASRAVVPINEIDPLKFVAGVDYAMSASLSLFANLTAVGRKAADRINNGAATVALFAPAGYAVADIGARFKPFKGFDVRLGINNIGDTKYWQWSDVRGVSSASTVKDAFSATPLNAYFNVTYQF